MKKSLCLIVLALALALTSYAKKHKHEEQIPPACPVDPTVCKCQLVMQCELVDDQVICFLVSVDCCQCSCDPTVIDCPITPIPYQPPCVGSECAPLPE